MKEMLAATEVGKELGKVSGASEPVRRSPSRKSLIQLVPASS
jgi:hypothetical protein